MNKEIENVEVNEDEMIDIAKEANSLISQRDKEIKELKLKLAKSELYSKPEEIDQSDVFDPNERLDFSGKSNLEIAKYFVNRTNYELKNGLPLSGGDEAVEISNLLSGVIAASGGDNHKFLNAYQMAVARDSQEAAMAFQKYGRN